MRKFIVGVAAFVVVTLVAYLGLFQRAAVMSLFAQGKLAAQGYAPAKTPSEALDGFRRALKERNYEAAELYLGGDYAEQFHKGSKNGQKLGASIDNLFNAMEVTGTKSDKVKFVLRWLDPFPTDVKVVDVKPAGDNRAYAVLGEETGAPLQVQGSFYDWRVDPRMFRSLCRSVGTQVELRKEGEGDRAQWKIYLPVTPELRLCVDYLSDNGSNYSNAIDRVKEDLKNDATTKESLENALRQALEESN